MSAGSFKTLGVDEEARLKLAELSGAEPQVCWLPTDDMGLWRDEADIERLAHQRPMFITTTWHAPDFVHGEMPLGAGSHLWWDHSVAEDCVRRNIERANGGWQLRGDLLFDFSSPSMLLFNRTRSIQILEYPMQQRSAVYIPEVTVLPKITDPWYPKLEHVNRPVVDTAAAACYLNRKPRTLRLWAGAGALHPIRINGRLAWDVSQIKHALGVPA